MYLMMPITSTILTKYPRLRRWCGPLGLVVTTASLVASAYATSVGQLIATQGVLYAIGCGLLFSPTSLYLDEWFIARKGLAYATMWAGKSIVGVGMPFLMNAVLSRYGLRTTLLSWAVASAILTIPLLVLLKPRVPLASTAQSAQRPLSFAFLRYNLFWMVQIGNIIQSMGYLMPSTYLASYAQSLGLPQLTGPVLLAVFAFASVPGGLFLGMLGDRLPATTGIMISSLGSTLAVFLLWGMSQHVAVLALFSIMYGFFAGGFSSTWSGILHEMKRQDAGVDTGLLFGMLMGGRGLGFVLSGPIGGALLESRKISAGSFSGYATEYGPMMICTGFTATFGAWAWFWSQGTRMVMLLRV
jgi:MFS family permease